MTPEERARALCDNFWEDTARAILAAVAEEREACAKVADKCWKEDDGDVRGITNAATAIRARTT